MKIKKAVPRDEGIYVATITMKKDDTIFFEANENGGLYYMSIDLKPTKGVKVYSADLEKDITYFAELIVKLNKGVKEKDLQDEDGDYDSVKFAGYKLPVIYTKSVSVKQPNGSYKTMPIKQFNVLKGHRLNEFTAKAINKTVAEAKAYLAK